MGGDSMVKPICNLEARPPFRLERAMGPRRLVKGEQKNEGVL